MDLNILSSDLRSHNFSNLVKYIIVNFGLQNYGPNSLITFRDFYKLYFLGDYFVIFKLYYPYI